MQHRLPMVATTEGGIRDMVKDRENGLIYGWNQVDSLVGALEKLITRPNLRKPMGEKGYEIYKKEFTLVAFEKRMLNLIRS